MADNPEGWREVDGVFLPPITWALQEQRTADELRERPKPYHEGRYSRVMNRIADAINERIPAPDIEPEALRNARAE